MVIGEPEEFIEPAVLRQTKKRNNIIHGCRAVNKQIPASFQRPTKDWDIWSKKPQEHAHELQHILDKKSGGDNFCDTSLPFADDEDRIVYRVIYCHTGEEVADFTRYPSNTKNLYTVIGGVRWETLEHAKNRYKEIIGISALRHRHLKAKADLDRVRAFERSLRRGEIDGVPYPFVMRPVKSSKNGVWW